MGANVVRKWSPDFHSASHIDWWVSAAVHTVHQIFTSAHQIVTHLVLY